MPRSLSSYAPVRSIVLERADCALILLAIGRDASDMPASAGRVWVRGRVIAERLTLRPAVHAQILLRGHAVLLDADRVAVELDLRRQARNEANRGYRRAGKERRRATAS